ncbi:hypothetical protein ATE84_3000 [Aquimarina sp. MAR_2010_214]|uniref:hypothetical protein n=1 Tax=Aquimarina sp. MAR_2010_214 TaxID=1250026 RepID=UPI000C707193|nr:hypothetical protein [Aquimarina sp. MAR_2010_214]PKV50931.1 hypothetical protein ATE84_3000 [Aquimarina sp. MAR_2010_214]
MKNILNENVLIISFGLLFLLLGCNQSSENNFNESASIGKTDSLLVNPLLEKVITVTINPKRNTMSTLYGNDIAWNYISSHSDSNYPKGSKLYEVTWFQQSDNVWFGANIPEKILKVECVIYTGLETSSYELYKGYPLKRVVNIDKKYQERIKEIASQRFAVVP